MQQLSIQARSFNVIPGHDRRGRMPFSGVLVHLDTPSDAAPDGAYGRRIIVTSDAGRRALSSLLGMAVNSTPSLDGHDAKRKIGVIESAHLVGNSIVIVGFVYAADFPEIASTIKSRKDALGFSFEAQRLSVLDRDAAVLTITDLAFTGAAIIRKDKAAYHLTSLAASAASHNERKEIKIMTSFVQQTEFPASAPKKPFPFSFTGPALAGALSKIGFDLPGGVSALAAARQPIGAGGHKISVHELDKVLAGYDMSVSKRMQFKAEMTRQGILRDEGERRIR